MLSAIRELMGYVRRYYSMNFDPEAAGLWIEPLRESELNDPYKTVVSLIEANKAMSLLKLKINQIIGRIPGSWQYDGANDLLTIVLDKMPAEFPIVDQSNLHANQNLTENLIMIGG